MIPPSGKNFKKILDVRVTITSWHGITPLKTLILQTETTTEKIKFIGYLILGEIKFCKLKNQHFAKKRPKS